MDNNILYLSQADVAQINLPMKEIIRAIEDMFREKVAGRVEMPPKPGVHPRPNAFIHAMPAYIPASNAAGMKWVSGYPENYKRGLPYINGLLVLNDVETGIPLVVMDCVWITAMRTGAATAVAAKYLARPNSETVGILGCGVQGRSNLLALSHLFSIKRVVVYDLNVDVAQRYVREMSEQLGLHITLESEPLAAVKKCDIVVTSGPILKSPHATIQPGWFEEGSFASLVDFDSYWHPDALHESDKFCTDDVHQLEHYRELGYFQNIPEIYADLGELVTHRRPGRESVKERTIACNLGLALEDMATAPLVYERALEKGIGTWLTL